nr:RNA polymerase sigma factor [uncultured Psychroserpens sp.]
MSTDQHIDVKLIKDYQAGNKHALTKLVERWHLQFCKKAYWVVKDADLSKDVAQESWKTIMDKLHTLEKPSSFKSWAFRIVFSKSMDAMRELSRKRLKENELRIEEKIVIVEDYDENVQLKEALLKAVNQLPEHQQIVIRLFYTQDYSLKDISKTLNISIGTAKSRLFHAREKLKLILKEKRNKY